MQVTVTTSPIEDAQDLLDSNGWDLLVDYVAADCIEVRKRLLTHTLDEIQLRLCQGQLRQYRRMFDHLYKLAGRKLSPKYLELFTGSEKE